MSMDKAIKSGKEHRKQYRGIKSWDYTCRNHGSDVWCRNNRLYKYRKSIDKANQKIDEVTENCVEDNYGNS